MHDTYLHRPFFAQYDRLEIKQRAQPTVLGLMHESCIETRANDIQAFTRSERADVSTYDIIVNYQQGFLPKPARSTTFSRTRTRSFGFSVCLATVFLFLFRQCLTPHISSVELAVSPRRIGQRRQRACKVDRTTFRRAEESRKRARSTRSSGGHAARGELRVRTEFSLRIPQCPGIY